MKLIDVFRFTEKLERLYNNQLLEYYRTLNTIINKSSNLFAKKWRDWMVDEAKSQEMLKVKHVDKVDKQKSEYDCLMDYFLLVIGKKAKTSFSAEEIINGNKFKVKINILEGVGDTKGKTDTESKPPVVNINIYTSALNDIIHNSNVAKKYAYKNVNDLVSMIDHLLTHELTHYFQVEKNAIDIDSESFVKKISKKKNLDVVRYFYYCTQQHELEALMNSAYKLYSERNSLLGDKKGNTVKRSYFRCLVCDVLIMLKLRDLANKFLMDKISLDDACHKLREHARFLLFWIVFYYARNNKKYKGLLEKTGELKTSFNYNINVMRENKEALYKFLDSLSFSGVSTLDNLLGKIDNVALFDQLLSTNTSNKKTIEELKNVLPRKAFKEP